MIVKKYKINLNVIKTGTTDVIINVPISMTSQNVDNAELIERVFVNNQVEEAINPITDYEKVRFLPLDMQGNHVDKIIYDIYLFDKLGTYKGFYGDVGFDDADIKYRKESFKQTFLYLSFYDSDNPLTQRLVTYTTLYPLLKSSDLVQASSTVPLGTPKPATQIPINFVVESPLLNPMGSAEGYHLYDYKSGLNIGDYKYLYMKAAFRNAKTGKSVNLMMKNTPQTIDKLVHELYVKVKLIRTATGFYYEFDDTYHGNAVVGVASGPNNVVYNTNTCKITLYEIKAI
jgi:hypothetical protein